VIYSADIAKSRDGKLWVLNDRTQSPSGSGYALENRMAMARIVPELFNGLKVRRLTPYYHAMHKALIDIAPRHTSRPHIVLLTPGQSNESYFEHSFLSSNLGFTLVQGDDLMVKDEQVWLKTLEGLEKVDVIVRRVDDVYCDPLELREDSLLGVPGLLQAVRCGNVRIANPLGSSVIENPGLIPFLPALSQYFLSEPLKLPTIASWWCGQPNELQYVLDNLNTLVIKRIFRESSSRTSVDASTLDAQGLKDLKARVMASPQLYVAQEKVDFASVPALVNGRMGSCHALFRSFAVREQGGFTVMEGGLTRTSIDKEDIFISNQSGGFSKDTWVLSEASDPAANTRRDQDFSNLGYQEYKSNTLSSRTAENLFWVGRYAERVLGNARYMRTVMQYAEEANKAFFDQGYALKRCLLKALDAFTHVSPVLFDQDADITEPWGRMSQVLFDKDLPGSLGYQIDCFTRTIHSVRDHWSTDTWRVLREMEDAWQQAESNSQKGHYRMLSSTDGVITSMMAFISLNRESISRNHGWKLLDAGRKIEQGLLLISLMGATLVEKQDEVIENLLLEAVLKSNESLVSYRYKYRSHLHLPLVLDLMIFDPDNPRSLLYQVERLKAYMADLSRNGSADDPAEHERLAREALRMIRDSGKDELSILDPATGRFRNLGSFLSDMGRILYAISDLVSITYFKHTQAQKQLFR
jgi:uncharacterized circularly permuted ATP-grasp superfamily protein/uncharacterized alpha-E superfamily protein